MVPVVKDELGEGADHQSLVILNYGDPTYLSRGRLVEGVTHAEAIFLHILAYLLFSDAVSIPSRYILEGDSMAQAVAWAAPLLEEGILQPERRADAASFEDLARQRSLPILSIERAAFMDRHVTKVRSFRYHNLEIAYRELINDDLSEDGGFRKVILGARKGRYKQAISDARTDYLGSGNPSPESVIASIARFAPELRGQAREWAMARYYTTPLLFDSWNTREIPSPAVDLLVRGRVIDPAIRPLEEAAPARWAFDRLRASVPVRGIAKNHQAYCEALLEVRSSVPEARRIFSDVSSRSHLKDAGDSLSAALAQELSKQQHTRLGGGRLFTLISSLLGGAVGEGISLALPPDNMALQVGSSLTFTVASGATSLKLQNILHQRKQQRLRSWVLAVDRFATLVSS
jgi:hypothetical protein